MAGVWRRACLDFTMKAASRANRLSWKGERVPTAVLYLMPRLLPLALVVILTAASGLQGIGAAALALSVWQFLLVVTDWGVSQWLLTKSAVTARELRTAFIGRLQASTLSALMLGLVLQLPILDLDSGLGWILVFALLLSGGQVAFAWALQQGRVPLAFLFATIEYVAPIAPAFFISNAVVSLSVVIVLKTVLACVLTGTLVVRAEWAEMPEGLSPKAFGYHSSGLALTSIASGTGELALLDRGVPVATVGAYRVFQSIASLGSIVGFAAQAPLMQRATEAGRRRGLSFQLAALGGLSVLLLAAGNVAGIVWIGAGIPEGRWLAFTIVVLGAAATMNTMSVVPLTRVAREYGSRYSLRVGIASSVTYWAMIGLLSVSHKPLLAPVAVLSAAIVGFCGNLIVLQWKRAAGKRGSLP
jgi:hypothetical protein